MFHSPIKATRLLIILVTLVLTSMAFAVPASANHSWGGYHWARTANPFTVRLIDSVTSGWNGYLGTASSDWSTPPDPSWTDVLDAPVIAGDDSNSTRKRCSASDGQVHVCNANYGFNGWLGIAQIWASGLHITKGTTKLNDSYFNTSTYNKPAWKQMVMCQEIGHTLGLDHQDENVDNTNLGTCMDYTSDPSTNQHPNKHDYDELGIIYSHLDTFTTLASQVRGASASANGGGNTPAEWGRLIRETNGGRTAVYGRDLGGAERQFTFVIRA